jgi:hypothetical protein
MGQQKIASLEEAGDKWFLQLTQGALLGSSPFYPFYPYQ